MESQKSNILNIPVAIILAGAIVGGAIIYTMKPAPSTNQPAEPGSKPVEMKPITDKDHILGNPNAKIKIVEYSDPSCPFCKVFHSTMKRIMNDYGKSGDVAWIYRNFPIYKPGTRPDGGILHPNAGHEAEALECAGYLGGNDKFWAFTNRLYEITPSVTADSPNGLDQNELPKIAEYVGLDVNDFKNCLDTGKFKDKIEKDYNEAISLGIEGTPSSILVTPNGKNVVMPGAYPYESIKQAIDALLSEGKSQTSDQATQNNQGN